MAQLSFTLRLSGSASTDFPLKINYDETYNAASNTSAIKITGFVGSGNLPGTLYGTVYINGKKAVSVGSHIDGNTLSVSATAVTVAHNADGSGSFTISFGTYGSGYRDDLYVYYANKQYVCTEKSRTVSLKKQTRNFTLHLSEGSGSTLLVTRGGAALTNGSTITYGDTLTVNCTPLDGYFLTENPSGTVKVTGDVSLSSAADVYSYSLLLTLGEHLSASVSRESSPLKGAATGALENGATVYHGDQLLVTYAAEEGYEVSTATAYGEPFDSGETIAVIGNIAIVLAADVLAVAHIVDGSEMAMYLVEIVDGGSFELFQPFIVDGGEWKPYM